MTDAAGVATDSVNVTDARAPADVIWTPHPGFQVRAVSCAADEALFGGAAGPGKTDVLVALAAWYAQSHPRAEVIFCRTVHKDLLQVLDRMHALYPRMGFRWVAQHNRWTHHGGGTILMAHAQTYAEAANSFLGQQYTHALWDEIGLLGDKRVWNELRTRLRSPGGHIRPRMRASANPGGPGHAWLKDRFVTPCGKDGAVSYRDAKTYDTVAYVPGRLRDNPSLDPKYVFKLRGGTELRRRQLEDGDWDAGEGLAFTVSRAVHVVEPFPVPEHWTVFGSHDWGFNHYWGFCLFAANEDGSVWLVDSTSGTGDQPDAIVDRVKRCLEKQGWGLERLTHTAAGHDLWNKRVAVGGNTPSLMEQYASAGWYVSKANISRVLGANNIRLYLQHTDAAGQAMVPRFQVMRTGHNERVWSMFESRVADPMDLEDVLKPKEGEDPDGLDDVYDTTRYGLASRPVAAARRPGSGPRDGFRLGLDVNGRPNPRERAMDQFEQDVLGIGRHRGLRTPAVGRLPRHGAT